MKFTTVLNTDVAHIRGDIVQSDNYHVLEEYVCMYTPSECLQPLPEYTVSHPKKS